VRVGLLRTRHEKTFEDTGERQVFFVVAGTKGAVTISFFPVGHHDHHHQGIAAGDGGGGAATGGTGAAGATGADGAGGAGAGGDAAAGGDVPQATVHRHAPHCTDDNCIYCKAVALYKHHHREAQA
jgi:hypothetical protein